MFTYFASLHEPIKHNTINHSVGWGSRISKFQLCRGVRPPIMSILDMILNCI